MAFRHPPDDHIPRVVRRGSLPPPGVVPYDEPRRGFFSRLVRFLLRPYIIIPVALLAVLTISVFGYSWVIFSARFDNLLKGEVFTRSAGIYAAAKPIRAGQAVSEDDLVAYLRRAGYVERGQQADSARGRYALNGQSLEVDPGVDSTVDGAKPFPQLRVEFARGGKSIAYLTDRQT